MTQVLLVIAVALTVGAIVFGIVVLVGGDDQGLRQAEPDGRARPLPAARPLTETDVQQVRFDTAVRGYRMAEVDAALRRVAYDIGYKDELVRVLNAEVDALRQGRFPDAEVLRRAREASVAGEAVPGMTGDRPAPEVADPEPEAAEPAEPALEVDAEPVAEPDPELPDAPVEEGDPEDGGSSEATSSDTAPTGHR